MHKFLRNARRLCGKITPPILVIFTSDGSGSLISADDICIDIQENKTIIPWTLSNYLKVSAIKFPSRARFYSVKVHQEHVGKNFVSFCIIC